MLCCLRVAARAGPTKLAADRAWVGVALHGQGATDAEAAAKPRRPPWQPSAGRVAEAAGLAAKSSAAQAIIGARIGRAARTAVHIVCCAVSVFPF